MKQTTKEINIIMYILKQYVNNLQNQSTATKSINTKTI